MSNLRTGVLNAFHAIESYTQDLFQHSKADAQLLGFTFISWAKMKPTNMINALLLQSVSLKTKREKKSSVEKKPRE